MIGTPKPSPGFLDQYEKYHMIGGRQVWTNKARTRFFTWDSLHGEIESFDKRGNHLGAFDATTGLKRKDAVRGRKLK